MIQVGDKVKVVGNICGHGFDIGEVITIHYIDIYSIEEDYIGSMSAIDSNGSQWWFTSYEIIKI